MKSITLTPFQERILKILINMQLDANASIDTFNYSYKGGKTDFKNENGYSISELESALNNIKSQLK